MSDVHVQVSTGRLRVSAGGEELVLEFNGLEGDYLVRVGEDELPPGSESVEGGVSGVLNASSGYLELDDGLGRRSDRVSVEPGRYEVSVSEVTSKLSPAGVDLLGAGIGLVFFVGAFVLPVVVLVAWLVAGSFPWSVAAALLAVVGISGAVLGLAWRTRPARDAVAKRKRELDAIPSLLVSLRQL